MVHWIKINSDKGIRIIKIADIDDIEISENYGIVEIRFIRRGLDLLREFYKDKDEGLKRVDYVLHLLNDGNNHIQIC